MAPSAAADKKLDQKESPPGPREKRKKSLIEEIPASAGMTVRLIRTA